MADEFVSYDKLIDAALRTVVRETLRYAAEHGLSGQHHLYLSFQTDFPGVQIADYLHQEYPDEMTIVLQHQFWGLEVTEEGFTVGLTFNKVGESLEIPFDAITRFADPSVQFGLQFQTPGSAAANAGSGAGDVGPIDKSAVDAESGVKDSATVGEASAATDGLSGADVITLDSFRKK